VEEAVEVDGAQLQCAPADVELGGGQGARL
jgi:hypothetical protein